jgi:hypothetical protein
MDLGGLECLGFLCLKVKGVQRGRRTRIDHRVLGLSLCLGLLFLNFGVSAVLRLLLYEWGICQINHFRNYSNYYLQKNTEY